MERQKHEYIRQLANDLRGHIRTILGVIPKQDAQAAARLLDEYAELLKQDRNSKLENALRAMAMEMDDGSPCWCSVAAGMGEEHADFCLTARGLTMSPASGIISLSSGTPPGQRADRADGPVDS